MNIFAGMILAEMSFHKASSSTSSKLGPLLKALPYTLVALGLYLCSYPDQYSEQTAWSAQLTHIGQSIFPKDCNISRYFASVGAQMVCLGVMLSSSMQQILSRPISLWLGTVSFPLYLLHGPLMRSVLVYLLYFPMSIGFKPTMRADGSPEPESYIPTPNSIRLGITLAIFFAFLLYVVRLWAIHVEPKMGAATDAFERFSRSWGKTPVGRCKLDEELLPLTIAKKESY